MDFGVAPQRPRLGEMGGMQDWSYGLLNSQGIRAKPTTAFARCPKSNKGILFRQPVRPHPDKAQTQQMTDSGRSETSGPFTSCSKHPKTSFYSLTV